MTSLFYRPSHSVFDKGTILIFISKLILINKPSPHYQYKSFSYTLPPLFEVTKYILYLQTQSRFVATVHVLLPKIKINAISKSLLQISKCTF
jgi:hypothetical protein